MRKHKNLQPTRFKITPLMCTLSIIRKTILIIQLFFSQNRIRSFHGRTLAIMQSLRSRVSFLEVVEGPILIMGGVVRIINRILGSILSLITLRLMKGLSYLNICGMEERKDTYSSTLLLMGFQRYLSFQMFLKKYRKEESMSKWMKNVKREI